MPFCTQCGTAVGDADRYCGKCGAPQALAGTSASSGGSTPNPLTGMSSRTASLLCYIPLVGWIAAIIVLASTRFRSDHDVRFNAFQGLYLFVVWLIVDWVVSPVFFIPGFAFHSVFPNLLKLVVFIVWIIMIIKVSQGELYRLPIVGELAERSVSEQR